MVSFSCEACNDTLVKKKLDNHRNQCRQAQFTCLDCNVTFQGTDYRAHTSCISEAQKYQGKLFRGDKPQKNGQANGGRQQQQQQGQQAGGWQQAQLQQYNRKATGANGAAFGAPRVLGQGNGGVKPAGQEDTEMGEAAPATNGDKKEEKVEEKKEEKKSEKKEEKKDKKRKRDDKEEAKSDKKSKSSESSESSEKSLKKLIKLAPKKGKSEMSFTEFLVEVKKDAALFAAFQELKVRRGDDGLVLFK